MRWCSTKPQATTTTTTAARRDLLDQKGDIIRGYFDDTGTHKGSSVTAAAGMVGAAHEWSALEVRWQKKLADYGLSDFSAAKCAQGEPPFDHLKGTERDSLVRELANLISEHHLLPISAAVEIEPWENLRAMDTPEGRLFFDRYPRPFLLCFDHCIQTAANWTKKVADGEPIALVFNEQKSDKTEMEEVFDAYKASSALTHTDDAGNLSSLARIEAVAAVQTNGRGSAFRSAR